MKRGLFMKKGTLKRLGSLFLVLALVFVMCPVAQKAAAATGDTCPCCGKAISSISWKEYSKWSNFLGSVDFSSGGHYRLTDAFTVKKEFTISNNVTIDFNGCKFQTKEGSRGFTVANGGTLNMLDLSGSTTGRIAGNSSVTAAGGCVYVESGGTFNLYSGRVVGTGIAYGGGSVYIASGGSMNMYGGGVESGSSSGDNKYGGNIYNSGTLNIYDGYVKDGSAEDHGGNIFCGSGSTTNIYGGTISGGKVLGGTNSSGSAFTGGGGNLYATGGASTLNIYGGTFTGGNNTSGGNGGNIQLNSGIQGYMYGGTIENGSATKGNNVSVTGSGTVNSATQYSALYILGGTITSGTDSSVDLTKNTSNTIAMYNCRYNGTQDVTGFKATCACYVTDDTGCTIWNSGYTHGTCLECIFAQAVQDELVELLSGNHTYTDDGNHTYTCSICAYSVSLENVVANINGILYGDITEALADAQEGTTLQLTADAVLDDVEVSGFTLDLNGHTLTADAFTSAAAGDVIDTSALSGGKLVATDVSLAENNSYLPVTMDDGIHFCPVGFKQWIEPQDGDTTKVKFYFTQRAKDTIIDDAINGGSTEINVQIRLTWTDSTGTAQDKTFAFSEALLQKYAEKWNSRVFVATVGGIADVSDLNYTWQITSKATTAGTTLSATTLVEAGYINENLTWDQINSFPLKTSDMTVEEMRERCVEFMEFTKTYLWTPSHTVSFDKNASGTDDVMSQGTVYGGLPYVGVASGNVYRMMDYIDPETGLLDMMKALPALATKDHLAMSDLKYFGSQCSISVYWGWGRVMNSADYMWTSSVVPNNGFIFLGDITIDDVSKWSATYNTDIACANNGTEVMFAAYAEAQKADGMVYYVETSDGDGAGHLVMVYTDAVTVYNDDGTINGDESYLEIIDQSQKWEEVTNASGDTFKRKNSIGLKRTFQQLYDSGYIPFTFAEFLGTDPIEVTEVSLIDGSGAALVSGTVSEEDRSFEGTTTAPDTLTWSQLFGSSITSNYGISDAYITVTDAYGNEFYRHAVRTDTAGNKDLELEEAGAMVTTWETRGLTAGKTYRVTIEVQLATGERPVIYTGKLAV